MVIDTGLIIINDGSKDVLNSSKDIDPSALIFLYLNGVPTFQLDSDKVSGRTVDVSGLPITVNDDLSLMYDELGA